MAVGLLTNGLGLTIAFFMQMLDQSLHLLAGCPIDTLHRLIPHSRVALSGNKLLFALTIGQPEFLMFITQAPHLGNQLLILPLPGQLAQLRQRLVDRTLLLFKPGPILGQSLRILAAQQDIFPLLNLALELQIGPLNQRRLLQRAVNQGLIIFDPVHQQTET